MEVVAKVRNRSSSLGAYCCVIVH